MLAVAFACALVSQNAQSADVHAPSSPPAASPAASPSSAAAVSVDEGAIVEVVEAVLDHGKSVARVAIPPVKDDDDARRKAVEIAIVRAVLDRRREEPVTPALLRAKLQANEATPDQLKQLACDHVLLASVASEGDQVVLHVKLVVVESGEVVDDESTPIASANGHEKTSASSVDVRRATERMADEIAFSVESKGVDVHTHRTAVAPLVAEGAAKEARLDRFTQAELVRALKRRGFLVVERAQLAAAMDQLTIAQLSDADAKEAPKLGQMLGAQSLVVGRVSDAGNAFLVDARVLSTEDGAVLGASSASLPRTDVVRMADVETRTPAEAAIRSAVAPGWGQAYNGDGGKALAFGVGGYGGLVATAGLGIGGAVEQAHYNDVGYFEKLPVAQARQEAHDSYAAFTTLYVATAVAGGVTAAIWGAGVVDALWSAPKD